MSGEDIVNREHEKPDRSPPEPPEPPPFDPDPRIVTLLEGGSKSKAMKLFRESQSRRR